MKSAIRNRAFHKIRTRRLLQCGTALPLALLAMPAHAACTVDGNTTTCTGDITTSGNGGPAILALGVDVTVSSSGSLSTEGDASGGIIAMRNFVYDPVENEGTHDISGGSVSVTSNGNITTVGRDSFGIAAGGNLGNTAITSTGIVSTAGLEAYGIIATGQNVTIESNGSITTAGDGAHGIVVVGMDMIDGEAEIVGGVPGDISITGGSVTTSGLGAIGVRAFSIDGDVNVTLDSVATSGDDDGNGGFSEGVFAESTSGTATVVMGSASAEGFAASGVVAIGGAGASVSAEETSIAGYNSVALYASSSQGAATVDAGSITLRGDWQSGVNAFSYGGAATVTVDSIVSEGTRGNGVYAEATGGVSVTSGSIDVEGNGARAVGLGGSSASIETTGNTIAEAGYALFGEGGDVSITTAADTLTQGGTYGIRAIASGNATIVNGGTAAATDDLGSAIHVAAPGAVSITSDAVTVAGAGAFPGVRDDGSGYRIEQGGIIVEGGEGSISIAAGSVDVAGEHRYGISARGNGTIGISAENVTLASADSVAVVARGGAGDVTVTTGTVTTTGASGVGVFANTTTGNISIDAGTTRVESEGMAGAFTGDAVVATSGSGTISITSANAFSAALYGSAVVGISGGDVSIVSETAETTGDGGAAIYGQSNAGNLVLTAQSITTSGDDTSAINAFAYNGTGDVTVGDITATGAHAMGVTATGRNMSVTVNGTVDTTGRGLLVSAGLENHILVNGTVTSAGGPAIVSIASHGVVEIAEGANVTGATGVALIGNPVGGFTEFYNSGTVTGTTGPAVFGGQNDPGFPPANFFIQNNGALSSAGQFVVVTGAGSDTFELTNRSHVEGVANLGDGDDTLLLTLNDDAPEGAIGQVAATINTEQLVVDSGAWRAEGVQSTYAFVEIAEGTSLTVVENAEGSLAIEAPSIALNGVLNLDLSVDETEGDLGETSIFGTGSLHLIGTATVELTDATGLQHTGGTFVENGELLLTTVYGGDVATSGEGVFELTEGGDFTGNLVNDGTFVFSQAADYDFLGDFSGSGLLEKHGDGTLTFAGLYAFEGTTSVLGGSVAFTGQLSEDTELDLAEGTVDLSQVEGGEQTIAQLSGEGGTLQLGETALVIEQIADTVFSGTITGMGELIKDGEGDLKLNGDGTGFTGTGEVNGGTLSVNGSFENATFEVNSGGTLGGSGTVGDTMIQGGTLAAGNSIGTLTVAGDLAFTAGSTLEVEVEVDPAGNADLIQVTGTATLGGAAVDVLAESGTYRPLTDYTILTAAGGVSGTFGSVDVNLAFLDPSLTYSANAVTLRLVRNDIDFASFAGTTNQAAIANLIESFGYGNTLYNETLTLVDSDVAPSFASLTGDVYPAYASATIETAEMLRRQTVGKAGGEGAYAWTTGLYNQVSSGNGAGGIELGGTGVAGGFGFGSNDFSVSAGIGILDQGRGGGQFSDGEVTFAVGRVAYDSSAGLIASAGAQFGWVDGSARRQTSLGAIDQAVTGTIEGDYLQLFGELGYRIALGEVAIEPFAGISHVALEFDSLTETGAATALAVSGIDRDVTFAQAGLRLSGDVSGLRPFASASYRRAWGDRASLANVGFVGVTGTALISADPIAKDAVELDAGLATATGPLELDVGYRGTISNGFDSHGLSAGLKFRF